MLALLISTKSTSIWRQFSDRCNASEARRYSKLVSSFPRGSHFHSCDYDLRFYPSHCGAKQVILGHLHSDHSLSYQLGSEWVSVATSQFLAVLNHCTLVWNKQEQRHKYWATRSSVRSFACSGLLASLAPSTALTCSLARSLTLLTPSLVRK